MQKITSVYFFPKGFYPLDYAIERHDLKTVQLLFNYGADPNIKNSEKAFINTAIENSMNDVVQLLIENEAAISGLPIPPLITAIKHHNAEAVDILMQSGASTSEMYQGSTVAQYAAKKKFPLKHLSDSGA